MLSVRRAPVGSYNPDDHCPIILPLTSKWYLENRVDEQKKYYQERQQKNENSVAIYRFGGLAPSIAAVLFGVAGSFWIWMAPWIAVATTLGAFITAYGLIGHRQYLAASFAATAARLDRVQVRFKAADDERLNELVSTTEDLLENEHAAWFDKITKTTSVPTTEPTTPNAEPVPLY
jgi:hypothetical protein